MHLAIIDLTTNEVVNIIVPPGEGQTWEPPAGHIAVETAVGAVGDTYDNGEFLPPVVEELAE